MNWKRGLFRLWLVAATVWLVVGGAILADAFTATRELSETSGVPPGLNEYDCLISNTACPSWRTHRKTVPDWNVRIRALAAFFFLPIAVPFLGWAGFHTTTWIARGFRQGRLS